VQFRILGPLEVVRDGRNVDMGTPKQRTVLALLLVHADRVVSLDRMIDVLWGDEGAARATAALQVYISNLRRILEPDRAPRTSAQVLVTQAPGYRLRAGPNDLDSACFEALVAQGQGLINGGDHLGARATLVEALALWRGPPWAEFSGEPFTHGEAARLDELRAVATEARWDAELVLGNHAVAVPELEALTGEYPFRERLWGLLMLALYRSGRQAEALRAFSAARRILGEEIGVDPSPALRRLEADILGQSPELEWHGRPGPPSGPSPVGASTADPDRSDTARVADDPTANDAVTSKVLVGRVPELGLLEAAADEAVSGRGRLVLVSGEAGIGKSRLLEELADRLARRCDVLWGNCHQGEGAPPYWPWIEALRGLFGQREPAAVATALGTGAGVLAQILPEILPPVGPPIAPQIGGAGVDLIGPPPLDPAAARFRLHQVIVDVLGRFARGRPLVVVLEDAQWADVASLELLRFLADRVPKAAILVVVSYRDAEPDASSLLAEVLGALARLPGLRRVALVGLGPSDVARYIVQTTDVEPSPAAVAAVHARTEGNPFFVGELARLLVSEGQLGMARSGSSVLEGVPTGVRDVIRTRLSRLPAATNEVLIVAAVIGREFELSVLAAAHQVDQDGALDLLDAALAAGLVGEDPGQIGRFRFSHALVRDTIYRELSALRRARLHARVGRILEAAAKLAPVAELANHFFLAAPVVGPDPAFGYALHAADAAQASLAYEQVEDQLHRALQLLEQMPAGPDRAELELGVQDRLAALLAMTQGYGSPDVSRAWARAHELCQQVDDSERLFGALWGLGTVHTARAEFKLLQEVAAQLLTIGEQRASGKWQMAGHFFVGLTELHTGSLLRAQASFETACQLAESLELSTAVADYFSQHPAATCRGYLASTAFLTGDASQAAGYATQVLQIASRLGHPHTSAGAYVATTALAILHRDAEAVLASADKGLEICQDHDFPMMESWLRAYRGWATAELGAVEAGIADLIHAIEAHQATGARIFTTAFMGLLADLEMRRGSTEQARALVEDALALVSAGEDRFYESELYRLRAELTARQGPHRHAEAAKWFRHAMGVAADRDAPLAGRRAEEALAKLGIKSPADAEDEGV
jgi:predicted ATPase/DNA-binding SARP family transcriptional activator